MKYEKGDRVELFMPLGEMITGTVEGEHAGEHFAGFILVKLDDHKAFSHILMHPRSMRKLS